MDKREVLQEVEPCVLHLTHSPVTIINERHHPFPQSWQRRVWGEVRDDRTVSLCATGHNSVHAAIRYYEKHQAFPSWCRGNTRELAQRAFDLLAEATSN